MENGVYLIGCNYAGLHYGESSMTPPWVDDDHSPIVLDTHEQIVHVPLSKETIRSARQDIPRYYQSLVKDHYYDNVQKGLQPS